MDGEVPVDIPSGRATLRLRPGRTLKQLRTVLGPAIKQHKVRGRLLGPCDRQGQWEPLERETWAALTGLRIDSVPSRPQLPPILSQLLHFQGNMTELLVMSPPEVADQSKATQQYMMASCCMHDDPAGSIRYETGRGTKGEKRGVH